MELSLAICAFLTLVSVAAAAFNSIVCGIIVYGWQKQLQSMLANAPLRINAAIEKAAADYLRAEQEIRAAHFSPKGNTDKEGDDEWMTRNAYL